MNARAWMLAFALLQPLEDLDWQVQRAVQEARRPALEPLARAATDIGKPVVVLGLLLGIAVLDREAGPPTARLALAALGAANLVVESLKRGVGRGRPDGERKRSNASFPSSHAGNAFALAWVLAHRWRRPAPVFYLFAALVAGSRVYLNRHFLSDVFAGAAIGLLCAYFVTRWLTARRTRRPRASSESRATLDG